MSSLETASPAASASQPNYKNWVPKGMAVGFGAASAGLIAAALLARKLQAQLLVQAGLGAAAAACTAYAGWSLFARKRFSFEDPNSVARRIIEGTASYVALPEGGTCLDVGCGSGALSLAVAKRNPQAQVLGVDRWGIEYSSFSQELCERNALAEGVANARFEKADATALPFADESFDAVCSNYVYHNVTGADKQELVRETLRCLKRGGSFAIHDLMGQGRYGNVLAFAQKLRDEGFAEVRIIHTDDGLFMSKSEARALMLTGSTLLVGTK